MTAPRPMLLIAAALIAGLGGRTARAVERAAAPVVFHKATKHAEVELRLPKVLAAWPAFRQSLLVSDTAKLNGFLRVAETAPSSAKPSRRSWRRIRYQVAGTTARLVSVVRSDDRDTGGAHPQPSVSAVLWDQRTKRRLPLSALFRPDADPAPLDKALCDDVKARKAERDGATPLDGETWKCPPFSQAQAALAPSTVAGKAGGLVALINPGEVGPYAEGQYRVVLPLAAIKRGLRPAYAAEFAGAPGPGGQALSDPEAESRPGARGAER